MVAEGYGALDRVAKAGDTMTGPLVLTGSPPLQIPAGAAAGYVPTSDGSGNLTLQAPSGATVMTALGDTTYGGASGVPVRLAGNAAATRKFYRQLGTGSASAAPVWDTLQSGDLPAVPGSLVGLAPSADSSGATDYTNIQGLLTLAGRAILQAGLFYVNRMLQISSNSRLEGAGMGITTIRMASGSWSAVTQIGASTGISAIQVYNGAAASNIVITGITFDGNQSAITAIPGWANTPSCAPVSLLDVTGLIVHQVQVINAIGYGLYPFGCASFQITQCRVLAGQSSTWGLSGSPTQQDGIHVAASQYGIIAGNIVDTGTLGGIGDDGIALESWGTGTSAITGVAVCGNTIRAAAAGIDLAMSGGPISNVTISGNVIWAALGAGVKTSPFAAGTSIVSNVTISGNTLGAVASGNSGDAAIELLDYTTQGSSGQGWQDIAISGNTIASCVNTGGAAIYVGQGYGLTINGNTLDGLDTEGGIQIGNNGAASCPVNNFTVTGNTVNMAATAVSGPAGIVVFDSHDGTITGNTAIGVHGGGSVGVLLIGVSGTNLITGVTVGPNRLTGWDTGVQEQNSGAQPDYNVINGNNVHGCTAGVLATGPHTISQQPVPDIGGVIDTEQFVALSSSYTLTSATTAQKLFNATANGTLTVPAATAFFFECEFDLTSLSATSGTFSFGLGGTATFTSLKYFASAQKSAAAGTLATWSSLVATSAGATVLVAASTTTTGGARISGILRVNAAGTIIPQITLSVAAVAAAVSANSWFRLTPVGVGSVASVGNWS